MPKRAYLFSPLLTVIGSVTVVIGVLVTGAGPHAGDPGTPRNGFDLEVIEHWHAYPAYLTLALASLIWFWLFQVRIEGLLAARRIQLALVCTLLLQAGVGIWQARTGVPASLVAIHMLLASILVSLLTLQQLAIRSK
jgi:cytochrome c oxidase assembly protein subunit 15